MDETQVISLTVDQSTGIILSAIIILAYTVLGGFLVAASATVLYHKGAQSTREVTQRLSVP